MGTMTKLKTKLRSSRHGKEGAGLSKPQQDGLVARHTGANATVSVADDVEDVFYAQTAPAGYRTTEQLRTADVGYRTTEQLRATGLEPLAEDRELPSARSASAAASDRSFASSAASDLSFSAPTLFRGASGAPADARAELADVRGELAALRREVMGELHTLRYDVLKELALLRGALSQLLAAPPAVQVQAPPAVPARADSPASSASTASSGSGSGPGSRAGSSADAAEVRAVLSRSPSVTTSDATRARLTAARPTATSRASSRLTSMAPVDDDVLSKPLSDAQLDELFPLVDPAADVGRLARQLAAGTREWALERAQRWLDSRFDVGDDALLVVVGDGGSGKSAFAARVCEQFGGGNLAAAHLCKFDRKAKSQPRVVLLSLVRQLVKALPGFKNQLARLNLKYVLQEPDVFALANKVLVDPLVALEEPIAAKFLVIDGLDQCRGIDGRNELLEFLAHVLPLLPAWLGVMLTSKPMPELARSLKVTSILDFSASNADFVADAKFLVDEIVDGAVVPEDRAEARKVLQRKSAGNMAYLTFTQRALSHPMATVLSQFDDPAANAALVTLDVLEELPESLYEIFMEIFDDKFGAGRARLWRKAQPLLTLIVAAAAGPYSLVRERAARELLSFSSDDMRLLRRAFVDIVSAQGGVFRIESSALFDWLVDESRRDEAFFVDPREGLGSLKKLQQLTFRSGSSGSTASDASSVDAAERVRAGSTRSVRTDSSRSPSRVHEPPNNPGQPVGILKRGRL